MSENNLFARSTKLLTNIQASGTPGNALNMPPGRKTYQASVDGTGAVTASVNIEGSNDGTHFDVIGTISISGTTNASDSFTSEDQYMFVRANPTAISGTSAAINATFSN